jgi:hypothetical protein
VTEGITVEIDWGRTGSYSEVGDNVTDLVRAGRAAIAVEYGRDQVTALAPTVSGTGSLVLDNSDRRFSPRATTLANGSTNPLYGKIKPALPVRIARTITGLPDPYSDTYGDPYDSNGATFTLFIGHTDANPINPDPSSKSVSVSLVDRLADSRGQTISTQLYSGVRTGEAIGHILDACGVSADERDLDPGATVIPWWWTDGKEALTALEEIIRSEGPPAMLTVGVDGAIVFRDRHHRLLNSGSTTSQSTWRATEGVEPVMNGFTYNESWANIINTGTATVDVRTPQELQQIWTDESVINLSAGEQRLITVSATDPFFGAIPPVAGTDYTVLSGSVTTALTRTSGMSTAIILHATSAAVISGLQLRAQPVTVAYTVQVSASDTASIDDFGSRAFPGDLPWCGPGDAEAVLTTAVAQRAQPLPIVQARFMVGNNTAKAGAILARDLSDRVTVIEPETVLSADFYVESIGHELSGPHDHSVTFGLEAAPTLPSPVFRLDTAGAGADQGLLGGGFDDPSNSLILDSAVAGHRLNEGVTTH